MIMNRRTVFWTVLLFAAFVSTNASAYEVETLVQSGPSSNRVDLLILGDGYRAEDQTKLTADANNIVESLKAHEVYRRYFGFFNVKVVHVISAEAGADQPNLGIQRDTALGASFRTGNLDYLTTHDSVATLNVAMDHASEFDQLLLLVNDPKYGGSGGSTAMATTHPLSADIAIHEIGHTLFNLGDEYPSSSSPSYRANISTTAVRSELKWAAWVLPETPLPTPPGPMFSDRVGAFQYTPSGYYRPVDTNCKMNNLSSDFCPVCTESGVLSIYDYVQLIEQASPASSVTLSRSSNNEQTFFVDGPAPSPNTLRYVWYYDGFVVGTSNVGQATLPNFFLNEGAHWLGVIAYDQTELVRKDDEGRLSDSHIWYLNITP